MEEIILRLTPKQAAALRELVESEHSPIEGIVLKALSESFLRFGCGCEECLHNGICSRQRGKGWRFRCDCSGYRSPPDFFEHKGSGPRIPY